MARPLLMVRRVLVALVALAMISLCGAACLEDLPEPVSCPPRDQIEAVGLFTVAPQPAGCWTPPAMASLTGGRGDCSCSPSECPLDDDSCYPDGDCPEIVREVADKDARCLEISSDNLIWAAPPQPQCGVCGCERCMSRCDGIGPVFAYTANGEPIDAIDFFAPFIDVRDMLPTRGTFGLYVRARGIAGGAVVYWSGDATDLLTLQAKTLDTGLVASFPFTATDATFQEHVIWSDAFQGSGLMKWDGDGDKPLVSLLGPYQSVGGALLIEIDCIIPFYVQ